MNIIKEISSEYFGSHPLIEMGATIEVIRPDRPCGIINEGLITTYPIEDVVDTMSRIFNLKKISKSDLHYIFTLLNNGKNLSYNGYISINHLNSDVVTFLVGNSEFNESIMDQYMNKYGYFLSNKAERGEWARYQYEKKFDIDVTDLVFKNGVLYHICPANLKDKILKQGLVPHKSKYPNFNNDYRLYFFIKNLGDFGFKIRAELFKDDKGINTDFLLIEVDTGKIEQEIKFYVDPRMQDAVYTLQGISPNSIKNIKVI